MADRFRSINSLASAISHVAVPVGLALALGSKVVPPRLTAVAMICSIFPDVDVVAFAHRIHYASLLGHRGLTHSLAFAALLAGLGAIFAPQLHASRWVAFAVVFLSILSHGILDALTTGGSGVAFFSPFSNKRFFCPWRVIQVSPIRVSQFFSPWGLSVLASELRYVWLPCISFGLIGFALRKFLGKP